MTRSCPECQGRGRYDPPSSDYDPRQWDLTCDLCGGSGRIKVPTTTFATKDARWLIGLAEYGLACRRQVPPPLKTLNDMQGRLARLRSLLDQEAPHD